jgi:hypothetical protein
MGSPTYYLEPGALAKRLALDGLVEQCGPPIRQLIERFDLSGRNLMSVGAGGAFEEIAFLQNGVRRAFLFDIDEHNSLTGILPTLGSPAPTSAPIVYTLDDFTRVQPDSDHLGPIGLLYFSGFTPDEMHRGAIHRAHIAALRAGGSSRRHGDPDWPADATPLHPIVLTAIDRYLADEGIVIIQSYFDGIDVLANPGYVEAWVRSLAKHHVALLEGYCFRASSAVTLWIGLKITSNGSRGDRGRLNEARHRLEMRPPLTRFHGRAMLEDKTIIRFYPSGGWARLATSVKARAKLALRPLLRR